MHDAGRKRRLGALLRILLLVTLLVALLVALLWVLTLGVLAVALLPSRVHFARNAPSAGVATTMAAVAAQSSRRELRLEV